MRKVARIVDVVAISSRGSWNRAVLSVAVTYDDNNEVALAHCDHRSDRMLIGYCIALSHHAADHMVGGQSGLVAGGILPRRCAFVIEVGVQILLFSCIPLIACIATYHLLTFRKYRLGTCYCGYCHHVLKDLIEPICPHCGQAI